MTKSFNHTTNGRLVRSKIPEQRQKVVLARNDRAPLKLPHEPSLEAIASAFEEQSHTARLLQRCDVASRSRVENTQFLQTAIPSASSNSLGHNLSIGSDDAFEPDVDKKILALRAINVSLDEVEWKA